MGMSDLSLPAEFAVVVDGNRKGRSASVGANHDTVT
jgi:hypothetical protein